MTHVQNIQSLAGHAFATTDASGWQANLSLRFRVQAGRRTQLVERRHSGPLLVQRPFYPEGDVCHAYLLHPPGGIVGGDHLQLNVACETGAHALLTTPAATKFYRSREAPARQTQRLRIESGATLEWLPQESIWFSGAWGRVTTLVELVPGAQFVGWESLCLGRPTSAERFAAGQAEVALEIYRAGQPLFIERLRAVGNGAMLDQHWGMNGCPFAATLIAVNADQTALDRIREAVTPQISGTWAATLIGDLLIGRYLGKAADDMRKALTTAWALLRPLLLGRTVSVPRVWAT